METCWCVHQHLSHINTSLACINTSLACPVTTQRKDPQEVLQAVYGPRHRRSTDRDTGEAAAQAQERQSIAREQESDAGLGRQQHKRRSVNASPGSNNATQTQGSGGRIREAAARHETLVNAAKLHEWKAAYCMHCHQGPLAPELGRILSLARFHMH